MRGYTLSKDSNPSPGATPQPKLASASFLTTAAEGGLCLSQWERELSPRTDRFNQTIMLYPHRNRCSVISGGQLRRTGTTLDPAPTEV